MRLDHCQNRNSFRFLAKHVQILLPDVAHRSATHQVRNKHGNCESRTRRRGAVLFSFRHGRSLQKSRCYARRSGASREVIRTILDSSARRPFHAAGCIMIAISESPCLPRAARRRLTTAACLPVFCCKMLAVVALGTAQPAANSIG